MHRAVGALAALLLLVAAGSAAGIPPSNGRLVVRNRTQESLYVVVEYGPIVVAAQEVPPGARMVARGLFRGDVWSAQADAPGLEAGKTWGFYPRHRQPRTRRWRIQEEELSSD
jgi:hypothetical protein